MACYPQVTCHLEHPTSPDPDHMPPLRLPTHPPPPLSPPVILAAPPTRCPATSSAGTGHPDTLKPPPPSMKANVLVTVQTRDARRSSAPGLRCPHGNSRVVSEGRNATVACGPGLSDWESSPPLPTPSPNLGTAREWAGSQGTQVSKPQLSPYPPVCSLRPFCCSLKDWHDAFGGGMGRGERGHAQASCPASSWQREASPGGAGGRAESRGGVDASSFCQGIPSVLSRESSHCHHDPHPPTALPLRLYHPQEKRCGLDQHCPTQTGCQPQTEPHV